MASAALLEHFATVPDPRVNRTRRHKLIDILAIAICAVIGGANNWVEVAKFGEAKEAWLRAFLELPNGIPSHDTFGRVFARLDPEAFSRCFAAWVEAVREATKGQVVAIDGKSVRGSRDSVRGRAAIHMVSAWAAHNRLTLGQVKVDEKSNEITAIPELLQALDLAGCIVTIDAMGCQRAIAQEVVEQEADYVLAVKANQARLQEELEDLFQAAQQYEFQGVPHDYARTVEKGHGRIETRECWATSDRSCLGYLSKGAQWPELRTVAMVRRQRRLLGREETTEEVAYYISSLEADASKILEAVRTHWSVESSLHWSLDVTFREDDCRVRIGHGPENLCLIRRFALSLLKRDTSKKGSLNTKRLLAAWDHDYLFQLLNQ